MCVDWPPDEADELTKELRARNLDFVPLLAPTSTPARIAKIATAASGFIYYVSLNGITGNALADMEGPRRHVDEIRALARKATGGSLPVAVGFGIKTPDDVRKVAAFADGVVVGTAAVKVIEAAVGAGTDPVPALETFIRGLRAAL